MEKEQRNLLYNAVVKCRRLLEDDFVQQLEGVYGIRPDGRTEALASLKHLDAVGQADRRAITAAIDHFGAAGMNGKQATQRFIRESAGSVPNCV